MTRLLGLFFFALIISAQYIPPGGSSGGPPTGAAGGSLAGTYPNPSLATLAQDLLFTDGTYDIGKTGTTRPRDIFLSRNLNVGNIATIGTTVLNGTTISVGGVEIVAAQDNAGSAVTDGPFKTLKFANGTGTTWTLTGLAGLLTVQPNVDTTSFLTLTGAQTATNKTLTAPLLTTPSFGPTAFTCTGSYCGLDITATTGATNAWVGHDGTGTYSGTHLSTTFTTLNVIKGLSQGSSKLFRVQHSTSAGDMVDVTATGNLQGETNAAGIKYLLSTAASQVSLASDMLFAFNSTTNLGGGALDTGLSRIAAGVVGFGTGALGSTAGTTKATNLWAVPVAVGSLPSCAAGTEGYHASVNDSNAASFTVGIGAVVAAGGSTKVPVYCDGTNWRIG